MPNLVGIFVKCFTSLHISTNLSQECSKFFHLFWFLFLSSHHILYILNWSPFLLDTLNFAKFLFLFLWGVLHHYICQQTLVTSVTSFYICSECYYYHTTIYSKFCSWSTFLFGTINLAKFSWYFCEMFYITSYVNKTWSRV